MNIFNIKLAADQRNNKNHKIGTLCFYGGIFWYLHNVLHRIALIWPALSSKFMEWNNLGIKTFKHAICAPNVLQKLSENQITTNFIDLTASNFVKISHIIY